MATSQLCYLIVGSIRTMHTSKTAAVDAFAHLAKRDSKLTGVVDSLAKNQQFNLSIGPRGAVRVTKA